MDTNFENEVNDVMNVETDNGNNVANDSELPPIQQKANAILRARLPHLADNGLNFEKRTGNFFRGTIVKEVETDDYGQERVDKKGRPVYKTDENGNPIEKVRRLVVNLDEEPISVQDAIADEVSAKRAAALILEEDTKRAKLEKNIKGLEALLYEAQTELDNFEQNVAAAFELVETFELPEKQKAQRITASVRVASLEDENAKLRAKLLELGIEF